VVCASPSVCLLCGSGGLRDKKPPGGALSEYRSLVSGNFLFGAVCAWRGVAGFNVAYLPQSVRDKVRPAPRACASHAIKFAQHAQNAPKSAFLRLLGEFFRENAAGVPLLGELCRARGGMRLVLGVCCRAQGAGAFFCVTGVLRGFNQTVTLAFSSMWPRHGHALPRDYDARVFLRFAMTRRQGPESMS